MKTKITYRDNDPESFIEALTNANPAGGSISLDQICSRVPNAERKDVIRALKEADNGVFVVGRKGHESRWLYGEAANNEAEKFQTRHQVRQLPTRTAQNQPVVSRPTLLGAGRTFADLSLRVSVGGKTSVIPLKVELVQAVPAGGIENEG